MESAWLPSKIKKILSKKKYLLDNYVSFINVHYSKPNKVIRKYEPKLISTSSKERARNKSIVECQVKEEKIRVMFDTEADLNVISEELVNRLVKQNRDLKIQISTTRVEIQ